MQSFEELNLSPAVTKAIHELGYTVPTPIQAATLPVLFAGQTDFLGMAATGTGKTAAYGIPLIESIDVTSRTTQGIVLCPTRELAIQVTAQLATLGRYKAIHVDAIYGGTGYGEQLRNLARGAHVIVATPGRLIDHLTRENLTLENVHTVVLDEADEMISMGFKDDLETILKSGPATKKTWLFAATMSQQLRRVADTYLKSPKVAQINRTEMLSGTVKQLYYVVRDKNKPKGICKLIDTADEFYGLIFCQTKALVVELTEYLRVRGYRVDCLHGDKGQHDRERTLKLFKEKNTNVLVCSDVAARGLDVKELTHVINYSLPYDLESYVHRIGRTGRSGAQGLALSLVAPTQEHLIQRIERATKSKMEVAMFPSRRDVSEKKMARFLLQFNDAIGHEKALELLGADWTAKLEGMTKNDIAARFLAMMFPQLFDDREKAEELALGSSEREERPRPQQRRPYQGGGRRFAGGGGGGGGPRRSGGPKPWFRKSGGGPSGGGKPFRGRENRSAAE